MLQNQLFLVILIQLLVLRSQSHNNYNKNSFSKRDERGKYNGKDKYAKKYQQSKNTKSQTKQTCYQSHNYKDQKKVEYNNQRKYAQKYVDNRNKKANEEVKVVQKNKIESTVKIVKKIVKDQPKQIPISIQTVENQECKQKQVIQQEIILRQEPTIKQEVVIFEEQNQLQKINILTQKQPTAQSCLQKQLFDYNLLVLTWVPEQCYNYNIECQKDWQKDDDLRTPTIHSFKPYGDTSNFEICSKSKNMCLNQAYMADFDIDQVLWNVSGLLYEISQYWPAVKFTHDEDFFYREQWRNYGTCYLMNMIEDNLNSYKYDPVGFNRTIIIQYFRAAIKNLKQIAIDLEPGTQYTDRDQLAKNIGFQGKQSHFIIGCNSKNEIFQIIFCYNRSKLPGKQVTIPCPIDDQCDDLKPLRVVKSNHQ